MASVVHAERVTPRTAEALERGIVFRPWAEQDERPYHREAQPFRRHTTQRAPAPRSTSASVSSTTASTRGVGRRSSSGRSTPGGNEPTP